MNEEIEKRRYWIKTVAEDPAIKVTVCTSLWIVLLALFSEGFCLSSIENIKHGQFYNIFQEFFTIAFNQVKVIATVSVAILYVQERPKAQKQSTWKIIHDAYISKIEVSDSRINALEDLVKYGESLKGLNLYHKDIEMGANLEKINLSGANLTAAILKKSNLQDAQLTEATLTKTDFSQSDLRGAYLRDSILFNTTFDDANLEYTDLEKAKCLGVSFKNANLDNANLRGIYFRDYGENNESKIDFTGASLNGTLLSKHLDKKYRDQCKAYHPEIIPDSIPFGLDRDGVYEHFSVHDDSMSDQEE